MFAGYGGASFALQKANIPAQCVGFSEIDKTAIKCFKQNFPNIINYGNCVNINPIKLPDFDLLTGGFPCQDVSIAGKGDLSKGRTTLFSEIIRIAEIKQPRFLFLENVKGILSKKHKSFFDHIISELKRINYFILEPKVLNSKDYGIPQNRERVFFICSKIESDLTSFQYPNRQKKTTPLKSVIQKNVSEKYYLTNHKKNNIDIICKTVNQNDLIKCIGILPESIKVKGNYFPRERIFSTDGIIRTLTTSFEHQPWILESGTILDKTKIRRLTPDECFILMGFDNHIKINISGISDEKLYKLSGNGWDINLVSKLFKELFKNV